MLLKSIKSLILNLEMLSFLENKKFKSRFYF